MKTKTKEFLLWVLVPIVLFTIAFVITNLNYAEHIAYVRRGWMQVAAFIVLLVVPSLNLLSIWRNEGSGSKWPTFFAWIIAFALLVGYSGSERFVPKVDSTHPKTEKR